MAYIPRKLKNHFCKNCGTPFKGRHNRIYCSKECLPSRTRVEPHGINDNVANGTVGAISELLVCADLMKKGWEVFRALSPHSNSDVLALRDGLLLKLEIRTGMYYNKDNGEKLFNYSKKNIIGKSVVVVTLPDNKIHYIDFEP